MSLLRRATAEAVGTAFLLAAIVGSGMMGAELASGHVAVALLANTLATASALAALIATFAPLSGAHFNPLVSLMFHVGGDLPRRDLATYMAAQCVGAVAGVWMAHAMFARPILEFSTRSRPGLSQGLAEIVATLGLLLVVGIGARRRPSAVPFAVGAYIASAYWFTSSTSFANPAVTLARSLTDTFTGIQPADVPRFLAGQTMGFLLAVAALRWLLPTPSRSS